ncbi:MAG TPA: hypothetical protein VFB72_18720 [Verrucomicrobiae bacterium]|nr:hypothetical protein [Verrucomicrobiae bacterium]
MSIETRIRKTAAKKVAVKITKRKRSKTGFRVWHIGDYTDVPDKAQALQVLLAKLRCFVPLKFSIEVRTRRDLFND